MADPMTGPAPRCQWCSAALPAPDLPTCPSCGATLTSTTGGEEIKGVTTLDTEAIIRARSEAARPRSRLLSFITGEQPVELNVGEAESLAPPDDAVRLEMRRLELEAERVDLEAEAVAMKTDVVVEQGIDLAAMADTSPSAPAAPAPTAPAAAAAAVPAPVAAAEPAPDADAAPAAPPPPPAG
ncbi:MAG TPA: hypothetical protein VFQ75_06540 [Candidatus Limnocylindrales bacterium]|jgi:hypothetical protein|nr:hypothetical protein [Candidatus Limnocylindrales bacterium]